MISNKTIDLAGFDYSEDLCDLLSDLLVACSHIYDEIPKQAAKSAISYTSSTNIHGEQQNSIDILANTILSDALKANSHARAYGSEEEDDCVALDPTGKYLVTFDPLDGSTNIEVAGTTATIFSILPAKPTQDGAISHQFKQPGVNQLCAGYALYSSSLTVILTDGKRVHSYVWLPTERQFVLTANVLNAAKDSKDISANLVGYKEWPQALIQFVEGQVLPQDSRYRLRYQATIASDLHRILHKGGLYLYPQNETRYPNGKIRLIYEAAPLALIAEAAGAKAIVGVNGQRILEVAATSLHQTVPVIYGSANEVERLSL